MGLRNMGYKVTQCLLGRARALTYNRINCSLLAHFQSREPSSKWPIIADGQ